MGYWAKASRFPSLFLGMPFAFNHFGMLSFASSVACAAITASGCIATSPIDFPEDENFPPSVVSEATAEYPLREIGQLNLDDPVDEPEVPLEVIVRDPNIDQTLEYRIFLDSTNPPASAEVPIDQGTLPPTGDVERPRTFTVSYDQLPPGVCHKIELVVVGSFAGFVEPRRPTQPGDVDNVTWWIEVVSADFPVIEDACQ
jgi:hypothetical protein